MYPAGTLLTIICMDAREICALPSCVPELATSGSSHVLPMFLEVDPHIAQDPGIETQNVNQLEGLHTIYHAAITH